MIRMPLPSLNIGIPIWIGMRTGYVTVIRMNSESIISCINKRRGTRINRRPRHKLNAGHIPADAVL